MKHFTLRSQGQRDTKGHLTKTYQYTVTGELALVFYASYERSGDSEAIKEERVQNAKDWYDYLLSIHN